MAQNKGHYMKAHNFQRDFFGFSSSSVNKNEKGLDVKYIQQAGLRRGWYITLDGRAWIVSALAEKLKLNPETVEAMLINAGAIKSKCDTLHFENKEDAIIIKESLELFMTLNKKENF